MITPTDQQDTFRFSFRESGGEKGLEKVDVVATFSASKDRGFTWSYLHHEARVRATLVSDWEPPRVYRAVGLSDKPNPALLAQLRSCLRQEIWDTFFEPEGQSQIPEPDRRQFVLTLLAYRLSQMRQPMTLQEAVYMIRESSRMSIPAFAAYCRLDRASVVLAEKGSRGLSPSNLEKLASAGDRFMEWKAAEYLRSQALIGRSKISRQGGRK